jgi:hypothetical protein
MRLLGASTLLFVVIATALAWSSSIPAGASDVYAIEGTVTDVHGNPLAGICVEAIDGTDNSGTVTASDGTYEVDHGGFATGSYTVYFSAGTNCTGTANYASQYYDNAPSAATATAVGVTAGETTTGIDAVMEPGGTIDGTVSAAAGGADLQGICVQARQIGSTEIWNAGTGPQGTYEINGLNSGTYQLEFFSPSANFCDAPGNAYVPQWYSDESSHGTADPVTVTAGEATTGINGSLVSTGLPGAPTIVTPTPGDGSASVAFSAPASDGGNSITAYTARASDLTDPMDGGQNVSGVSSPLLVSGLINGDSYTFTVTATNSAGTGPASNPSNAVIPTGSPSTPPTPTTPLPTTQPPTTQHGYWLVGSDGGIFTFGSANFYGSTGNLALQRPVVGITPTADKQGYWLDASDGGVFAFGDAGFYGSIPGIGLAPAGTTGSKHLNAPIVGMVPSTDGGGYFMVASDGGVFAFGDARFEGSCPAIGGCSGAVVAVLPDGTGNGYWLVTQTGNVYSFGDAPYFGAPGNTGSPVTSAASLHNINGYVILTANGAVYNYNVATVLGGVFGAATSTNPATAVFLNAQGISGWVAFANGTVVSMAAGAPFLGSIRFKLNAPIIAATGF